MWYTDKGRYRCMHFFTIDELIPNELQFFFSVEIKKNQTDQELIRHIFICSTKHILEIQGAKTNCTYDRSAYRQNFPSISCNI